MGILPGALLVLAAVVASTQAYPYNAYDNYYQRSRCADSRKPCRLSMTLANDRGEPIQTHSAELCSCNFPATCPTDWNQTDHLISRNLISSTYRTTLNLMFCDSVQPQRDCVGGEPAVVLSGYLEIPNELESYNCACQGGVPLQLNRRWRTPSFKYMHEYVCDNQKPTCSISVQPCVQVQGMESRYNCKCPGRTQCHMPHADWGRLADSPLLGYCGPLIRRRHQ
ncbi:hypothetical protein ElyMa_005617900 [Elysia marginata]|uniref:Uncharacterized protein n=1 Tax=Elysia marginata TaxID=1093978 RepID=A0AAV4F800_9GAST|nr:hypothetical protein ElyMa_005617900 [Elysia marginata]